jgi:Na+-transporting NADH:ubiquinone oxidoreductase subunit NqrD
METNPYEPPRQPEPLTTEQKMKRGLGVGAILLLTPVAVGVAFGASCLTTIAVVDSPALNNSGPNAPLVVGLLTFFIPPALVLIAMIWWAVRAARRDRNLS